MRIGSLLQTLVTLGLSIWPFVSTPGQQPNIQLDSAIVHEVVESVAVVVEREYFDADLATRVAARLRKQVAEGQYDDAQTLDALAEMMTVDLFESSKDKHLVVAVIPAPMLTPESTTPAEDRATEARRANFAVQRVEVLPGNVGYLNLTAFYRPEEARDVISAAMRVLRSADALILDMRFNAGGSPETVALLASYLFDTPELSLFEIVPRSGQGRRFATEKPAVDGRDEGRPVYVLTAEGTFSAGEGLAFILQERRRAEIVGECTAGAANPGRPYSAHDRFEVTVPNGQVRSAVSGRNWEGDGVMPDVKVPAQDALRVAHIRALRELIQRVIGGAWEQQLKNELQELERSGP